MATPAPMSETAPNLLESDRPVQDALDEIFSIADPTREPHSRVEYFQQEGGPLECLVDVTYYGNREKGIPADKNRRFIHMRFDVPDQETGEYTQVTITDTERVYDPRRNFKENGLGPAGHVDTINASVLNVSRDGHILSGQTRTTAWDLKAVATYPAKHFNSGTEGLLEISAGIIDSFGNDRYPYQQSPDNRRQPTYFAPGEQGFKTGIDLFAMKLIGMRYDINKRLIMDN